MKQVSIITNMDKDKDLKITKQVISILDKFNTKIVMNEDICDILKISKYKIAEQRLYSEPDFIIVLGGDGTLLNVARQSAEYGTPIIGINLGHLGFLVELENSNLESSFEKIFSDNYTIDTRMMIEGTLYREDKPIDTFIALNDIGITRDSFSRIINLKVFVDNNFVDSFPADGIVVSTPTGSTAYSLSAGGPIIDPSMNLLMITPICPHTLHSRSIIVPDNKTINIHVEDSYKHDAMITVDGQHGFTLEASDIIAIKKSTYITKLIRTEDRSFYSILRKKLSERTSN